MDSKTQSERGGLREAVLALSSTTKKAVGVVADVLILPIALWLAFLLRLGTENLINPVEYYWLFLAAPLVAVPVFAGFGLYKAILRYMGRDAVSSIFKAVSVASLLLALVIYLVRSDLLIPRTLVLNYWMLSFALVGGIRFLARAYLLPTSRRSRIGALLRHNTGHANKRNVVIYGAGAAGYQLYKSIENDAMIEPVAFIDDDTRLQGRTLSGLRVLNRKAIGELIRLRDVSEVFLAIPSLEPGRRSEILKALEALQLHVRTVPSVAELTTGRKEVAELEEIRVEDILGRDVVAPDPALMNVCVESKVVMVTGAGGSIGSELCRQIIRLNPKTLVLFDHSEFALYSVTEELRRSLAREAIDVDCPSVLGSALNAGQLRSTILRYKVDTVFHAAAYKHVSVVEHNISSGVRNNALGTLHAAYAAMHYGVSNFVLISSDKAVRPTSVMGASKRLSEMILQSLAAEEAPSFRGFKNHPLNETRSTTKTRFTIVRFGNVVASSGSVIPKFRSQIDAGGPVTVTDRDATRYFMTSAEAAQLVIQASAMGAGGDVFLLDMGEPVSILDLAIRMIHLAGRRPSLPGNDAGDIEIRFTGLSQGEKLHEVLLDGSELLKTGHPKISRIQVPFPRWVDLKNALLQIQQATDQGNDMEVVTLLESIIEGFARPEGTLPAATSAADGNIVLLNPNHPTRQT